ncbi:hypothetical protein HanIR_Chr04g0159291 [Helianthus annuus]|nr:hypothetical protein HanIR_Chr04g0159291 [Helianthus annuus]
MPKQPLTVTTREQLAWILTPATVEQAPTTSNCHIEIGQCGSHEAPKGKVQVRAS